MATQIKITQLTDIGSNIVSNTVLPVVNLAGTAITQKTNVGNLGNAILANAGTTLKPAFLANLAYSVVNAAQPNITSVGTLSINTLNISGGENGQYLQTDGAGHLSWVTGTGSGNGTVGGANGQLQFNLNGNFSGDPELTWDAGNNQLNTVNFAASSATIYGNLNVINVNATGNLRPNAIYTDHYYYANGYVFGGGGGNGTPGGTDTQIQFNDNGAFGGNSGFTFDKTTGIFTSPFLAGNGNGLSNIQGANVSGAVGLATYAGTANAVAGANVSGAVTYAGTANSVAVANVVGIGNIATVALSGNPNQVLYGNGVFDSIPNPFNQDLNTTDNVTFANITSTDVIKFSNSGNIVGAMGYAPNYVSIEGYGSNSVNITANDIYTWTFGSGGDLTIPAGDANNIVSGQIFSGNESSFINLDVQFDSNVLGGVRLGTSATKPVDIVTGNGGGYNTWRFDSNGEIITPDGTHIGNIEGANTFGFYNANATDFLIEGPNNVTWSFNTGTANTAMPGNVTIGTGNAGVLLKSNADGFGIDSSIASITNGSTTVEVTLNDVEFPGPVSGSVRITGVQGETEANGYWGWQAVDVNVIQLYTDSTLTTPVDGTTWSAYTGGGHAISSGYNNLDIIGGNVAIQSGAGKYWSFNPDGGFVPPIMTIDLHNGGNQQAQLLQLGNPSYQAVITGPTPALNTNAERLIIQGQRGSGTGEGGDVYVWAGDANTNGGDIKIYAGDADDGSVGYGGYINLDAGSGYTYGGQLSLTGGYSQGGGGGPVNISGGQGTDGGIVSIYGGGGATNQGGNINIEGGYGQGNGGQVRITGGGSALGLPGYGNVVINAGASSWTFDNGGNLTVPGEGIIQSINDTVILRSVDANSNIYSARLGTNGGLYFETTEYPYGWLNLTNSSGDANISSPGGSINIDSANGTGGGAGKSINITAGDADQTDYYTTAGGEINIQGGMGAFNDGGGGGPGGNINLVAGTSADPAGVAGNINITSGTKDWIFDNGGSLTVPGPIMGDGLNLYGESTAESYAFITIPNNINSASTPVHIANDNGNVDISTINQGTSATYHWTYDNTGNITLPGNTFAVNYANGTQVSLGSGYGDSNVVTLLSSFGSNTITTTGNVSVGNIIGNGQALTGITGANVTGAVAYATTANSVAVGNVSGLGNIATVNLDGSSSNVLYGNGVFAAAASGSSSNISNGNSNVNIASANGNVTIAAVGNSVVTITGTGANITGTANISGNANVGNLGVAAVVATANISTTGYFISGNQATGGFQLGNSNSRLKSGDGNSYMTMGQSPAIYPDTAASALSGVVFGGYGYLLGNNGSRCITLNYGGSSGVVGLQANVQVGSAGSGTVLVPGTVTTGVNSVLAGPSFTPLANTMAGFVSNVNYYTQLTIQNKNTGTDATTDFVATADNGSDTVNYLDMGIINSGYDNGTPTNSLGNIVFAADSYMYAQGNTSNASQSGGNLAIGTTVAGKNVKIFAGGVDNTAIVANIANTGVTITGNLSVSGNITATNIGNVAAINLDGSSSNILYGNGVFAAASSGSGSNISNGTSNVNISTSGGNVQIVSGGNIIANITGTGVNVAGTLSATGNIQATGQLRKIGGYTGTAWGASGAGLVVTNSIYTDTSTAAGTQNVNYVNSLAGGILAFSNAVTVTTAAGLYVSAPTAGTNATITNSYAIVTGNSISVNGNIVLTGNVVGNTGGYALGYRDIPQIAASNTTLALTDAGKHYYSTTAGNLTLTIPLNASVAFPTGTAISIVVQAAGNILVNAASGVTLYMAGNSTSANRVVGTYGMATLMKVASDTWFINGTGVS